MVQRTPVATAALYEVDETAWLEVTADLIRTGGSLRSNSTPWRSI